MNLSELLQTMRPILATDTYVFITGDHPHAQDLDPICTFREAEGLTRIVTRAAAEQAGIPYEFPCRMITLDVHSSLEAVGFLAAVTTQLAAEGMGVNPVAGFYHDHLFVPEDRADDAMAALGDLP